MNHDLVLLAYLRADLQAHGALPLPLPPRVPSFGDARVLHLPTAGIPSTATTIAPRKAAA